MLIIYFSKVTVSNTTTRNFHLVFSFHSVLFYMAMQIFILCHRLRIFTNVTIPFPFNSTHRLPASF